MTNLVNLKQNQKETLKKVLKYIKKYRIYLIMSLILAFVTVVLTLYIPKITGQTLDYMMGKNHVDFKNVISKLIQIIIFVLITGLAQWFMNLCNNKMTYCVVRDIRNDAFKKIEKLPLKFIDSHSYGEIESRVIADADQFADGLLMGFTQLFTGVITILGTLMFMFSINIIITIVVVLVTPLSFFVAGFISKRTFHMFKKQSEIRGMQTAFVNEMIEGQKVIKAFNRQEITLKKFDEINDKLNECSLKATFFSSLTNPSTRFVNSLVYTGVGIAGAISAINGIVTVGQLSAFLSYSNQYTKPFNEISGVVTELQNAIACAARLFELIEEQEEIQEAENALDLCDVEGNIEIKDMSFSYVSDQHLIENFDLSVKPGQKVAIVGPTGCGKTTLINLLMRFYDVTSGKILVDNNEISEVTRSSLRNSYGMVLQETWLKSGTIRENITMGNPSISEKEMVKVAKICHIHHFINRLPKKYDTIITENGGEFSQGQKQLLCIARVMMSKPAMLILDEATSSIDTRTEIKIQEAFEKLMDGRTTFIVAHRLATIRSADIILVMKNGSIIEKGNHKDLMKKRGFYYNLYQSQFLGKEI
ncbi:ABC transporter ATP-binding protein [Lachnobacterium bovis]|uniref:ATP-binding cassette, subfamily B n=1 Tax=Lachnobacterium bovis TaxID=140626 RepID=A0A1H9T9W9_9FIRM|nr:ABC transporter ATP-binding protein [Lachnobacterium bovis]SER94022.1 ATP-binding cassette, subfamily B [Lachnobacterium bovis]